MSQSMSSPGTSTNEGIRSCAGWFNLLIVPLGAMACSGTIAPDSGSGGDGGPGGAGAGAGAGSGQMPHCTEGGSRADGTWALRGTTLLDGLAPGGGVPQDFVDLEGWGEQPRLAVDSADTVYVAWVHNASPEANGGPADGPGGFQSSNPGSAEGINTT